jgi:hypothetical protein
MISSGTSAVAVVAAYYINNKRGRRPGLQELFLLSPSDLYEVVPDRLKVKREIRRRVSILGSVTNLRRS